MTTPTYLAAPLWVLHRAGHNGHDNLGERPLTVEDVMLELARSGKVWTRLVEVETALELGWQAAANDWLHKTGYKVTRADHHSIGGAL